MAKVEPGREGTGDAEADRVLSAARELANAWSSDMVGVAGPGAGRLIHAIESVRHGVAQLDLDVVEQPDGAIGMDSTIIGIKLADAIEILLAAQGVSRCLNTMDSLRDVQPERLRDLLIELDSAVRRGAR